MADTPTPQAEMLANRLRKRHRHLRKWARREGVSCFRLYDGDIPEIPLAIDLYEAWLHIAENKSARGREAADHRAWLAGLAAAAGAALDMPPERVVLKRREQKEGATPFDQGHTELVAHEGGLKFLVNLSDYWDTGLFLDHRATRARVRSEAAGRRFLNLFGYTGSFSVYAAAGGALATTTVDLSNRYLEWAERNMALNGFARPEHRFVRADILEWLAQPTRERYDLAVLDPPTFSQSKKMARTFVVQDDHVFLVNATLARLSAGGVLYFSNNFRGFRLDADALHAAHIEEISHLTRPPDFRDERIHRCWRMAKG